MQPATIGATLVEMYCGDEPYRLWSVDIYVCPWCGHKVTVSGKKPVYPSDPTGEVKRLLQEGATVIFEFETVDDAMEYGRGKWAEKNG